MPNRSQVNGIVVNGDTFSPVEFSGIGVLFEQSVGFEASPIIEIEQSVGFAFEGVAISFEQEVAFKLTAGGGVDLSNVAVLFAQDVRREYSGTAASIVQVVLE